MHPYQFIGNVVGFIFISLIVLFTITSYINLTKNNITPNYDNFVIGYVEDYKQIVTKQNNDGFFNDCVNALNSLGYKKSEAKARAKQILSSNPVTTVEEFIIIACRK